MVQPILGIQASGWRSFPGEQPLELLELSSVNLLIGPNNAGKSNVFRLLQWIRGLRRNSAPLENGMLAEDDSWRHEPGKLSVKLTLHGSRFASTQVQPGLDLVGDSVFLLELTADTQRLGVVPTLSVLDGTHAPRQMVVKENGKVSKWSSVSNRYISMDGTEELVYKLPVAILDELRKSVVYFHALRTTKPHGQLEEGETDGSNVLEEANALAAGPLSSWNRIERQLCKWLSRIIGREVERFDIKKNANKIRVQIGYDGLQYDMESLGSGVTEIVLVLLHLLVGAKSQSVILIEEPEAHLHPASAVEFARIVASQNKQVIVSTHGTSLVDAIEPDWRLFQMRVTERGSLCRSIWPTDRPDLLGLLQDLGIRPSQLFLANNVILVEGPSDVLYLESLLRLARPHLLNGRDYAFLIYGGSSVLHFGFGDASPDSDEPGALVDLLSVMQNPLVVHDSDSEKEKSYVKRLRSAAKVCAVPVISTAPFREAENMIRPELLWDALTATAQSSVRLDSGNTQLRFPSYPTGKRGPPSRSRSEDRLRAFSDAIRLVGRQPSKAQKAAAKRVRDRLEKKKVSIAQRVLRCPDPFAEGTREWIEALASRLK